MAPRKGAAGGSGPLCADVGGLQAHGGRRPRSRPLCVAVGAALPAAILRAGWGIAEAGCPASASAPASAPPRAIRARGRSPIPRRTAAPGEFDHFIVRVTTGGVPVVDDQSHLEVHGPLQV
jgi:hypothetical protein